MSLKDINVDEFKEYYLHNTCKNVAVKYGIAPSTVAGWARKLNLPRKAFFHLNENLQLTELQKQVLIGSLLGDGSLRKIKYPNDNSHFEEGHSIDQLDWLSWKRDILKPFSREITFKNKKGFNKVHRHCNLNTMAHPIFKEMERQWYKRDENDNYIFKINNNKNYRIKIVPEFELTPLILAVWYIDDGSNDQTTKNFKFSTQGFQKSEIEILIEKIKKLGIHDCKIGNHTGFVIYIGTYSYLDFISLVKNALPDLPQTLQYKLDTSNYNSATKWSDNKTGIPFFRLDGKKYYGTVMINYKSIYLGLHDYDTAVKISNEVEFLVRHRCRDIDKFIEVKNKYKN